MFEGLLNHETKLKKTHHPYDCDVKIAHESSVKAELSPEEKMRVNEALELLSNVSITNKGAYVTLRVDEPRATIDDVYTDLQYGKRTEQDTIDRWLELYINKNGKPIGRLHPGRNILIEELEGMDIFTAFQLSNGIKCILPSELSDTHKDIIDELELRLNIAYEVVEKFGLPENLPEHIIVFTPQASIADSMCDTARKVVIVGTHTAKNVSTEATVVAAHEITHGQFQIALMSEGIDYEILNGPHFLYPTLQFFNEGIATLAHETSRGFDAKAELKNNFNLIPALVRQQIETGSFSFGRTMEERQILNSSVMGAADDQRTRTRILSLISRYLPAVVTQYCIENNITIQDILRTQLSYFEPVKDKVAEKYQATKEMVTPDIISTCQLIKEKNPSLFVDTNAYVELVGDIEKMATDAYLKPFEVLGIIQNKDSSAIVVDFMSWLRQ